MPVIGSNRPGVKQARLKAERAYQAKAMAGYNAAWKVVESGFDEVKKHPLLSAKVKSDVQSAIVAGLEAGATEAARIIAAAENAWWKRPTKRIAKAATWQDIQPDALYQRYLKNFKWRDKTGKMVKGSFKDVGQTATDRIQESLSTFFADAEEGTSDLAFRLSAQNALGSWKAAAIATTETTRMASANVDLMMEQVGADTWVWQGSEDDYECEECMALDGQEFGPGDDPPPLHVGCRCGQGITLPGDEAEGQALMDQYGITFDVSDGDELQEGED
jgi:uncharacterized protein with gpF-like domain